MVPGARLVVLGKQGAGKGTQCARLANHYVVSWISTGDMLRAAVKAGTEFGKKAAEIMQAGELVPDELMIELIRERLGAPDTASGFILDGFPRTYAQAEALDEMLAEIDRALALVLEFQLPDEVAYERLLVRGRSDDTPEMIRHRLDVQRVPDEVVAYYRARGILVGVQADRSVDEVFADVQSVLQTAAAR